ncbi:hypothetical protein AYI68_g4824 [Smittium mucronatum]|uniref:Uncharacterized protein n=1 Tax=Smittium mucronatum TaxID=133383 RepID=A0A1R0GW06_9FUNG|nr:hypothetical protein AYI68_g4824 [Smittium mucronatum]
MNPSAKFSSSAFGSASKYWSTTQNVDGDSSCDTNKLLKDEIIPRNPLFGVESLGSHTSALIPHTTEVSPILTVEDPSAVPIPPID